MGLARSDADSATCRILRVSLGDMLGSAPLPLDELGEKGTGG